MDQTMAINTFYDQIPNEVKLMIFIELYKDTRIRPKRRSDPVEKLLSTPLLVSRDFVHKNDFFLAVSKAIEHIEIRSSTNLDSLSRVWDDEHTRHLKHLRFNTDLMSNDEYFTLRQLRLYLPNLERISSRVSSTFFHVHGCGGNNSIRIDPTKCLCPPLRGLTQIHLRNRIPSDKYTPLVCSAANDYQYKWLNALLSDISRNALAHEPSFRKVEVVLQFTCEFWPSTGPTATRSSRSQSREMYMSNKDWIARSYPEDDEDGVKSVIELPQLTMKEIFSHPGTAMSVKKLVQTMERQARAFTDVGDCAGALP